MGRLDLFDGLVPFVAIGEAGSFRDAARSLGVTASAVSKALAKLEDDVGVRLVHRTSRRVALTTEGQEFLQTCREALGRVRVARERLQDSRRAPSGLLRVSLPPIFGRHIVAAIPRLLAAHPALEVEVLQTDRFVQLAEENVDVAVRIGTIEDSTYVVRKLRTLRLATVASPAYVARQGTPRRPRDLAAHNCLKFVMPNGVARPWLFGRRRKPSIVRVGGRFSADHGEALLTAAIAGIGIVQAPDVMVADALERGELIEILRPYAARGPDLVALSAPGRKSSPKVRAFIELMTALHGERP